MLLPHGAAWPESAGALKVPGSWTGKEVAGQTQSSAGVGTYRVRIRLPTERPHRLALRLGAVTAAYDLSIDGTPVLSVGVPAATRAETVGRVAPHTVGFAPRGDVIELRIAVANHHHRKGGIRRPVYLGTSDQLQSKARGRAAFDAVVAGLALLLGLYHLLLWGLRPADRSNLAFGAFALCMGFRGLLVGESLLPGLIWTEMPYSWRIALEYLSMNLGFPLLWWIMREMFPKEVPRSWLVAAIGITVPLLGICLFTPPTVYTSTVLISRLLILVSIPLAIVALVRAGLAGREGAWFILGGQILLSAAVVHDIAFHSGMLTNDIELGTLGFALLLASQAVALALRFGSSFERVETLSRDLSVAHAYNESILFSLKSGVLTFDREGMVAKSNRAAATILGQDPDDRDAEDVFGANPHVLERMDEATRTGSGVQVDDVAIARPVGEPTSANLSVAPLVDEEEQPLGLLVVVEDISHERRLKATMARYMSREVAEKLIAGGDDALGGKLSEATVLFSDIRKFSTVSEGLGPRGTVQMLNEYFTIMVDEVFRQGGILDKYIGDAIMAVFGAIGDDLDHAERAVRCSVGMLWLSDQLNRDREARGEVPIKIGIGLNTDEIVHGNIGSPRRMDYTVIGDGVNLAARLESANVTYGTQILLSEHTRKALPADYREALLHRELDLVAVKGKTEAVRIYEVLEHRRGADSHWAESLEAFEGALGLYRSRQFAPARAAFSALLDRVPGDGPSALYVARCSHFLEEPPPPDWDGVWRMKTK